MVSSEFDRLFYRLPLSPRQLYSQTQDFICFISVVLTEHSFKNFLVFFFSFKVPYVSNFTIIKKENVPSLQEYNIMNGKINFYQSSRTPVLQLITRFFYFI